MERHIPSRDEVLAYLKEDRNWGRWGDDDQLGAMNMVTPEKRVTAARLVRTGRAVSLSRVYPKTPAANNPNPAQHFMKRNPREPGGGSAVDYYGVPTTGRPTPTWTPCATSGTRTGCGMAAARRMSLPMTGQPGARLSTGRRESLPGESSLTFPAPERALRHHGKPHPRLGTGGHREGRGNNDGARRCGDRLRGPGKVGRGQWHLGRRPLRAARPARILPEVSSGIGLLPPGVDMMDFMPNGYDIPWSVHGATSPTASASWTTPCWSPWPRPAPKRDGTKFMLTVNPLRVVGGTGSPVNPIALF